MNLNDAEFELFWDWLTDIAAENDAWWLGSWLEDHKDTWDNMPIHSCGCKRVRSTDVWSKTGHHRLETIVACAKCDEVISRRDYTEHIKNLVKSGNVLAKDCAMLKKELNIQ